MYRIIDTKTGTLLQGTAGHIDWTSDPEVARIFKRREDVRQFLKYVGDIPSDWVVQAMKTIVVGNKLACIVHEEGII